MFNKICLLFIYYSNLFSDMADDQAVTQYPILTVNGKLFPSFVAKNFKQYTLEAIKMDDTDACNVKTKDELRNYQKFVTAYLDYRSPYREILLYHGLGAGKTATAINVYNMLYNYTPGWNFFILIKASLRGTWLEELEKWLGKQNRDHRYSNLKFINYDSPFADRDFINAIKESDASKKRLYVVDECHNFISNVYNNITTKKGKRAHTIYDYIMSDKKENPDTRIIMISGTPSINSPFELALLFNLLRPGIFPKNEAQFEETYILENHINPEKVNLFQRRILGLTSYYIGAEANPKLFATQKVHHKVLEMSPYQEEIYRFYEDIEEKLEKARLSSRKGGSTTYKTYTRGSANFVFPPINDKVNGESRPRPNNFRLSEKETELINLGLIDQATAKDDKKKVDKDDIDEVADGEEIKDEKKLQIMEYQDALAKFLRDLMKYWTDIREKDASNGHTIEDDFKTFETKYKFKYNEFLKNEEKKSKLFQSLHSCSAKFTACLFYARRSKGPILVFSNFVAMEGLEIFKMYLAITGHTAFDFQSPQSGKDHYRYTEFHGQIDFELRTKNRLIFNDKNNMDGHIIKYILLGPAGAEGISLRNVRQVHVLDPYWNEVRIKQLIGRAIRQLSHCDLPMNERHVDVYRYLTTRKGGNKTTDEYIYELAMKKENLINSFLKLVKQAAVDCATNAPQNMVNEKYTCFQFDENALLEQYIGPAYKEDLYYDLKLDNGLNAITTEVKKVKTYEITAGYYKDTTMITGKYWFNPDTGILYDHDLDFPIGKLSMDEDGIPIKIEKDIYQIGYLIPIPDLVINT